MKDGRKTRILGGLWLLSILVPGAAGQEANVRLPISSERVAEAIVAAGVPIIATQVRFLSQVTAIGQGSGLEVVKVAKWSGDRLRVELRCHDQRDCLPFYVLVEGGAAAMSDAVSPVLKGGNPPRRDILRVFPRQILMRNGEHATMVFENPSVRITMPVICLENGDRGQTIRVETTDHKQFFKAEIVESGLLKVNL